MFAAPRENFANADPRHVGEGAESMQLLYRKGVCHRFAEAVAVATRIPALLASRRHTVARTVGYSVPFVLGTPRRRGSDSTAIRSARAVALKIASAMWWLFRP
jgi:hypothetical protein